MSLHKIHLACIAPALLLSACATNVPPHAYLSDGARDKIASTEVVMPIRQNEIYIYVPPSTAGASAGAGLGMLGALVGAVVDTSINNVRTGKAETAVKPLRDALVDYNFDTTMQDDIKASLAPVTAIHADNFRVAKEVTPQAMDGALAGSKDGAVLFTSADYHLSNDGGELDIVMTAMLFPNTEELRSMAPKSSAKERTDARNALYRNTFAFQASAPNLSADRDQNIQAWSGNNAAAMRADLALAEQKLAQMVASDLQATEAGDGAKPEETVTESGVEMKLVSADADGRLLRSKDGTLKYIKK